MKKIIFITLSFIFLQLSCSLPKLGIEKKNIQSGRLKTNGFFYNKPDYWSFMLYQNGILQGDFGVDEKRIESVIRQFTDSNYTKSCYSVPYCWGVFNIDNDTIKIEHWESREWAAYGKTKYSGIILNDSTLILNHPVVGRDTFYFYYLPVKPDSTNKFIK